MKNSIANKIERLVNPPLDNKKNVTDEERNEINRMLRNEIYVRWQTKRALAEEYRFESSNMREYFL